MSIPTEITRGHILQALRRLDVMGEANWRTSQKYDLYYEERRYPPKEVVRYASEIATGEMFESFGGGKEANDFLMQRGFSVVHKGTTIPVPLRYSPSTTNQSAPIRLETIPPGPRNPFEDEELVVPIRRTIVSSDVNVFTIEHKPEQLFADPTDLQYIEEEPVTETEREAVMKTRVGQSSFKAALLERECKCKLCGVEDSRFLIASHIKPWRDATDYEKLDVHNGFLLCPNHDQAFDKGYISFQDDGSILISNSVDEQTLLFLNIHKSFRIPLTLGQRRYMEWHRTYIFKA